MKITSTNDPHGNIAIENAQKKNKNNKVDELDECSEQQKLEAFKTEIWKEINGWPRDNSINWSIQITDEGFKRMMNDPEYKNKIMRVLKEDADVGRPPITSTLARVDENGYSGCAYNFGYGEEFYNTHSNDKDSFYKKTAVNKNNNEELLDRIWEDKKNKEYLQRKRLNQEYIEDLEHKNEYNRERVAQNYENNIITL